MNLKEAKEITGGLSSPSKDAWLRLQPASMESVSPG
jgi:hypothetical protein